MLHIAGGYSAGGLHVTVLHAAGRLTPFFWELLSSQFFLFVLAAGERGWSCTRRHPRLRCCLDEVAHAAAEEVPPRALVLHVIVDLGDDGVRALSVVELFVARGSQELHLRLDERRERELAEGHPEIRKKRVLNCSLIWI